MKRNFTPAFLHFRIVPVMLFFLFILAGCGQHSDSTTAPAPVSKVTGKFLTLSDVHFNPFFDPNIFKSLVQLDVSKWDSIFKSSSVKGFGQYGEDSNYELMISAFSQMSQTLKNPDFIVITGDFLGHNFESDFDGLYSQYFQQPTQADLNSFGTKTIRFMSMKLQESFPNVPFYPVLGNNDDLCGDYEVQPNDPFLTIFMNAWASPLDSINGTNTFRQTFPTGGYYMTSLPGNPDQVIIGLNTIFLSPKNTVSCVPVDSTSGFTELKWLRQTLAACKASNKKVWLTCHIPPGADVYSSLSHQGSEKQCLDHLKMMWKNPYLDTFLALETEYSSIITGGLGGHTHQDEFRVIYDASGTPVSFFHINPSISPIDGNNPGFEVFSYDTASMIMTDYSGYTFQGVEDPTTPVWMHAYDFDSTYHVTNLTAQSMAQVWQSLKTDSTLIKAYSTYYGGGSPQELPSPWTPFWCGNGLMQESVFGACACSDTAVVSSVSKAKKKK